jgi:hypothetical protein
MLYGASSSDRSIAFVREGITDRTQLERSNGQEKYTVEGRFSMGNEG